MFELVSCGGEVPTLEARHTPGTPHSTRVQLTLSGDLHCQTEPVVLDKTITDASGEIWLGELLNGGDLGPARRDEESEEVYTTQVAGGRRIIRVMCTLYISLVPRCGGGLENEANYTCVICDVCVCVDGGGGVLYLRVTQLYSW